jgi:hypothetical protein
MPKMAADRNGVTDDGYQFMPPNSFEAERISIRPAIPGLVIFNHVLNREFGHPYQR